MISYFSIFFESQRFLLKFGSHIAGLLTLPQVFCMINREGQSIFSFSSFESLPPLQEYLSVFSATSSQFYVFFLIEIMGAVLRASVFVSWVLFNSCFITLAMAGVQFSTLPRNLVLTSAIRSQDSSHSNVAKAGEDELVVTWGLNESVSVSGGGVDSSYKSVKVKLCFAPVSQVERGWRKTNDDLKKDKTCQFQITQQPYSSSSSANNTVTWTVAKDVPGATYFVRVYALDATGTQVAYGQTTNKNKTTNLFVVEPISGRHVSLDIAAAVFSIFSIASLFGLFTVEKMRAKK